MTISQEYMNESIAQIVAVAATAAVMQYWQKGRMEMEMSLPGAEVLTQVWDPG